MKYIQPKSVILAFAKAPAARIRAAIRGSLSSLGLRPGSGAFTSGVYQRFSAHSVCNLLAGGRGEERGERRPVTAVCYG